MWSEWLVAGSGGVHGEERNQSHAVMTDTGEERERGLEKVDTTAVCPEHLV